MLKRRDLLLFLFQGFRELLSDRFVLSFFLCQLRTNTLQLLSRLNELILRVLPFAPRLGEQTFQPAVFILQFPCVHAKKYARWPLLVSSFCQNFRNKMSSRSCENARRNEGFPGAFTPTKNDNISTGQGESFSTTHALQIDASQQHRQFVATYFDGLLIVTDLW